MPPGDGEPAYGHILEDSDTLKCHLSKGTAEKYKKDIDEIAAPEAETSFLMRHLVRKT